MPAPYSCTFSLTVDGWSQDQLVVAAFSGTETLSRAFDFQVDFVPLDGVPIQWEEMLDKPAALAFELERGEARHVHGHVHGVESLGSADGWPRYRVRLAPDLERLRHVHRSRVFQEKTTQEIVKQVLDDAGIRHRWSLGASYGKREYCLQYRETDLAFISRLLEWEGIFYWFEHSPDGHELVLSDDSASAPETPGGADLPLREADGMVPGEEQLTRFEQVRRVRPGAVVTRDFDFKSPSLDLGAAAEASEDPPELELYDYAEGYGAPADARRISAVRLEERQQGRHTHAGASTCPRLSPGYTFQLREPAPGGLAGKYLAVEVRHHGERRLAHADRLAPEDGVYRNELRSLPEGTPFRPRREGRWPVLPGVQTAVVVGPPGEEIHPDEHGRIKVQFHWDRAGAKDDRSSCFIRVGQAWGGPGWGGVFLPRVGQEVVVRFLEGNPDRPLITGAVYNGQNATPYPLPADKTMSTLKSSSSPGGDGSNELRLEDAAGEEEIFLHAQKDEAFVTENDKEQEIRRHEARLVKKDRTTVVEGNQSLAVALNDKGLVEKNQSLQVTGDRTTAVTGNHAEGVDGQQSVQVAKFQMVQVAMTAHTGVGAAATLQVGGGLGVTVALAASATVAGVMSRKIGGNVLESVAGGREEIVKKDLLLKVEGESEAKIDGALSLTMGGDASFQVNGASRTEIEAEALCAAKSVSLKADKLTVIVGDKQMLLMNKSGDIALTATSITFDDS